MPTGLLKLVIIGFLELYLHKNISIVIYPCVFGEPPLLFMSIHFTTLCFTSLCFTTLCFTSLCFTSLCFTQLASLHFTSLHFTSLHFASHFASLHFASLYLTSLHIHFASIRPAPSRARAQSHHGGRPMAHSYPWFTCGTCCRGGQSQNMD